MNLPLHSSEVKSTSDLFSRHLEITDPDKVVFLKVRISGADGPIISLKGRAAWAVAHLIRAGRAGITTLERPAPRWSHYIWLARGEGVSISTENEHHGGRFKGNHGRFRLESALDIIEIREAGGEAA